MKGYKGFGKGLICRGKQYAENTVFEEENAVICNSGMHFCENPFDVLDHYDLVNEDGSFNDFAEVEALADVKTDDNKKYCTTKLRIGAKLSFAGFIKACVDFVIEKTQIDIPNSKVNKKDDTLISSKTKNAQIGSSGDSAQIGSSGDYAQIGSSGYSERLALRDIPKDWLFGRFRTDWLFGRFRTDWLFGRFRTDWQHGRGFRYLLRRA